MVQQVLVWILLLLSQIRASRPATPSRPNIVFILADDLGWNDVGFTGRSDLQTPNIDALAYHGRILSQHYSQPTCTPSRAALLTGKYPIRTGMQGFPLTPGEPRALPLDQRLLPQYMKELGYQTHLVGKWHVGCHEWKYTPTARGFDTHFGYLNGYIGYYNHTMDILNMTGHDFWRGVEPLYDLRGRYVTDLLTEESVRLIENAGSEKNSVPLFLLISHLAPHSGNPGSYHEYPEEDLERFNYIPDMNRRKYAAMVWNLDKSVGHVVKALAETKMLHNTIIAFVSDNGAQTIGLFPNDGSNYPFRGLKFTMFEGGVRTSALIWSPQLHGTQKEVSSQMFHVTDWLPTLYAAAGGEVRELSGLDGHNQWEALLSPEKTSFHDYAVRKEMLLNIDESLGLQGIRYRQWKLVMGSYLNGSYDGFLGDYTESPYVYKFADVKKSLVANSLRSFPFDHVSLTEDNMQKLRSQTLVNCDVTTNALGPQLPENVPCVLSQAPCLFDLSIDPCERSNLATTLVEVTTTLAAKLDTYMQQLKPQLNEPVDELANPKYFNQTWIPWREEYFLKRFSSSANLDRSTASAADNLHLFMSVMVLPVAVLRLIF